jgi:TonB C terminal
MARMRITSDSEVAAPRPACLTGPQAHSGGEDPARRQRSCAERESRSDPAPTRLPQATGRWQRLIQRTSREPRPLALALLLSLLIHALLLSLTFGGEELGLPGLVFPWRDRRIEVPDLRVVLVPARVTPAEPAVISVAEPSQRVSIEPPVAGGPAPTPTVSPAPRPRRRAVANTPAAKPTAQADATRNAVASAAPAEAPVHAKGPDRAAPVQIPEPAELDVEPSDGPSSDVRADPFSPMSVIAVAPGASSPETVTSASRDPGDVAQEAQREEAARQETARVEAARLEAERQETARQATAQLEVQRREAARREAARVEAARLEAARQATAPPVTSRVEVGQDEAARREAARRAIGRQLDEEAARREAASTAARSPSPLPLSLSTARRVRLWGRTDPNAELVLYAEAWARKIQFNTPVDAVREVAKQPRTNPMVTVAIRSDGSVESVTFVVSSGVSAVDDAIRRIIESQTPFQRFTPGLASEYDVVEIRRTWYFDDAIRLY